MQITKETVISFSLLFLIEFGNLIEVRIIFLGQAYKLDTIMHLCHFFSVSHYALNFFLLFMFAKSLFCYYFLVYKSKTKNSLPIGKILFVMP